MEKKSIVKFIELKDKFDLRDIWTIKNPKTKRYTFRQKHVSVSGLMLKTPQLFLHFCSMQSSEKNLSSQLPS